MFITIFNSVSALVRKERDELAVRKLKQSDNDFE